MTNDELIHEIQVTLHERPWHGQGYRKPWTQLKHRGVRTASQRVLRIMRDHGLLARTTAGRTGEPQDHDGTIIPKAPDPPWRTDAASIMTSDSRATVFVLVDHFTGECLGAHAEREGQESDEARPQPLAEPEGPGLRWRAWSPTRPRQRASRLPSKDRAGIRASRLTRSPAIQSMTSCRYRATSRL